MDMLLESHVTPKITFIFSFDAVSVSGFCCWFFFSQPLLSAEELAETRRVVEEFGRPGGTGEVLHQRLEKRAQSSPNWVRVSLFAVLLFRPNFIGSVIQVEVK